MDRFVRRSVPVLLALLVILAPQAGGAVYRWCAVTAAVIVLTMATLGLGRRSVWHNTRVDATCWMLTAVAALTLLQLVPLPFHLVKLISPKVAGFYAAAATMPLAPQHYFIPLTADLSLTAAEALKWASYAALYVIVLNWPRGGGHQLPKIMIVAGTLTAVVCLVESVFRVEGILGIYHPPVSVSSWLRGPFVNPGHSGIYCALLGTLGLGAAAESSPRWRLWVRLLSAVLLALALTPAARKTGVAVVAGVGVYLFLRARAADYRWTRGWPVVVALSLLATVAVFSIWRLPSVDQIRAMPDRYLAYRHYSRIITWSDTLRLIADSPWTGVGRGSFGPAFTAYDSVNTDAVTWHPESVPLQMAAEWGLIPALAFLIGMTIAVVRTARNARGAFPCAAAATLVMLGLVNLVDFNLELLGIALTAIVCLAVLARKETKSIRVRQGRVALIAPATLVVAALVGMATVGVPSLAGDAENLRAQAKTTAAADRHSLDRLGSAAAAKHPADFFIPQLVAAEHLRLQLSLGIVWLNRALELRPRSPEAHFLTGMALLRGGRAKQALLEYVTSARFTSRLLAPVADLILRAPSLRRIAFSDLWWATTEDKGLLSYLALSLSAASPARERFLVDERLLQLQPDAPTVVAVLNREKSLMAQDADLSARLDQALTVDSLNQSEGYVLPTADLRARNGRVGEALAMLTSAAMNAANSEQAATKLVELLLHTNQPDEALARLRALELADRLPRGDAEFLRGRIYEHRGNLQGALDSYAMAAQYNPDDVDTLVAAALAAHHAARSDLELQFAHRALQAGRSDGAVREKLAPLWGPEEDGKGRTAVPNRQ